MGNITRNHNITVDMNKPLTRQHVGYLLAEGDNKGDCFTFTLQRGGRAIAGGMDVSAYLVRQDGSTVFLTGEAEGNKASVTLDDTCYAVNGGFTLTVKVTQDGVTTTVAMLDGYIRLTATDKVVDPGEALPSLEDILHEYDSMEAATAETLEASAATRAATAEIAASSAPANVKETTGNVLVIHDSAHRAMQGLKLYGKTADDMTAVEDVTVKAQGKNLLNVAEAIRTHATAVVTLDGDKLHVTTDGTSTYSGAKIAGFRLQAGVTYMLSANVEAVSGSPRICFRKTSGASMIVSKSGTGKLTLKYTPDESVDARVDLLCCEGTAMAGEVVFSDVQLEVSKEATAYEAYKDGGSVTIATGGLHGILVANGGNYRSDAGAQYVADCIDLGSGQRVQHIGVIDSYAGEDVGDVWQSSTGELTTGAMVVYALPEPVVTALEADLLVAHASLCMQSPTPVAPW